MKECFAGRRPLRLTELNLPKTWRILVAAPHPDDFDAMGVALRHFQDRGYALRLLVLSSSANGVEDSFRDPPTAAAKAALREAEQLASCRFFGLPAEDLEFLRLPVDLPGGFLVDSDSSYRRFSERAACFRPDLVLLPHGNDTNPDHRLTYRWWTKLGREMSKPAAALLVRDPKTIAMRDDIFLPFDERAGAWKAELLRFHASQHRRNLNTRGHGFDERILRVNRDNAVRLGIPEPYAESFELEFS
jgi:LmbE family N-acetylglucosaminyl deacetylase